MRLCGFSHPLERWYNPFVSFIIKGKKFFATMRQKARRSVLRNITFFEVHIEKRPRYYRSNVRIVARFCMYTLANATKRGGLACKKYCRLLFPGFYRNILQRRGSAAGLSCFPRPAAAAKPHRQKNCSNVFWFASAVRRRTIF